MNSYTLSMKSTVSEKGQVTIPKPLRDRLGIQPGQVLDFEEDRGRLVARKVSEQDPVDAVYGILKIGRPTDELITEMRGDADAE
jgi:AbrB family looped-hinge helix DNA binding protein